MYNDGEGEDETTQEDSANRVRSAPETNTDPVFPDQDTIGRAFRPSRPEKWRRTRLRGGI